MQAGDGDSLTLQDAPGLGGSIQRHERETQNFRLAGAQLVVGDNLSPDTARGR